MLRGNSGGFISISDTVLSEQDHPNDLYPPSPLPSRINVFVKPKQSLIPPNSPHYKELQSQQQQTPTQQPQRQQPLITVNSIKSNELIQTPIKNISIKRIKTPKNYQPLSPSPLPPTPSKGRFSFEPPILEERGDLEDLLLSPIKKESVFAHQNHQQRYSVFELHDHLMDQSTSSIPEDMQLESVFMSPIYNKGLDFEELEDILLLNNNNTSFSDINESNTLSAIQTTIDRNRVNRKRDEPLDEYEEYSNFLNSLQGSDVSDDENDIFELRSNNASGGEEGFSQVSEKIETKEILELFEEEESFIRDAREAMLQAMFLEEEQEASFDDSSFIKQLTAQINLHLQLLVQNMALSSEVVGGDKVWIVFLKMLIHFVPKVAGMDGIALLGGVKNLLKIINQSPQHSLLLARMMSQSSIISDPDLMLKASVCPIKLVTKHPFVPNLLSESFWKFLSIFGVFPYPQFELTHLLNLGKEGTINIPVMGRRSDSFLEVEDALLLRGLRRFGLGNWEKIQSTFLPTRTSVQIATRYKNLTNRRAPDSDIKKFATEATRALSAVERGLLMQGVRTYGHDWKRISQRFLPHRASSVLEKIWNKHLMVFDAKTIINTQFDSDDDNDDSDYVEEEEEEESDFGNRKLFNK